ncbi:MAG: hypothetical protein HUK16_09025 [Bacteroidales bacterium]|nr:hypothetical protein [Bacteroidales bacterium]
MAKKKKEKPKIKTVLPKEKTIIGGFTKILLWILILFVASIIISYLI